jgi:hypothetical protein
MSFKNLGPLPSQSKKFQTRVKAYPILRSIIYTKYTTVEINPQYLDQLLHNYMSIAGKNVL